MCLAGGQEVIDEDSEAPTALRLVDLIAFDSVAGVDVWVQRLADEGVDRVWLAPDPADRGGGLAAHVASAFVGGTPAGLLTVGQTGSYLWRARWQPGQRVEPPGPIWLANYQPEAVTLQPPRLALAAAATELDNTLQRAAEFAGRQDLTSWRELFTNARRQWSGTGDPGRVPFPDLFPNSWPDPDGPRLMRVVQAAWVFGGMGSWNDLGFAADVVQQEYDEVSCGLFDAVMHACIAAVNVEFGRHR